jgi:hypothetical protein
MKNLLILLMAVFLVGAVSSCDLLKQSVATTAELYVGELKGQPVKYIDKAGYLQHFIDMKAPGFWAEHIKGVDFSPVKDFYGEIPSSNTQEPGGEVTETADGRKLYWIPLFSSSGELLIKPYTRVLH